MRALRFSIVLFSVTCLLSAQNQKDTISSTAEIVTVPVIVTDSSGKHVRGLKQDDFSISENGKPQRIASFEEVTAQKQPVRSVTQQNGIYTNRVETDNALALGIVVVDFVNTRAVNQYWAIRGAMNFLEKWKGKGGFNQPMMMAAITREGLRIVHQATTDPSVLETAMAFVKSSPSPGRENNQGTLALASDPPRDATGNPIVNASTPPTKSGPSTAEQLQQAKLEAQMVDQMERQNEVIRAAANDADTKTTMWALQALANGVAGIPGRKAMVWSSEIFPFKSVQEEFGSPQWTAVHGSSDEDPDLKPLRDATLLALNRANIAVYPVNAGGLLTPDYFDASWADRSLMTGGQWATKVVARSEANSGENNLYARLVADQTGGKACMANNDIGDCIGRALDDATHYYMLTYYPDPKPKNAGWRKIKVDVKGDKINVRARNSYFYGAVPTYGTPAKSEVAVALQSNLDYTSLPLVLKFTGLKPGQGNKRIAQFVIGVDGRALSIDEEHGNKISLLIGAQAQASDNPVIISIDTKLKPDVVEQIRAKQLTHAGEMEITPGKYDVRVVVRDNFTGRIGSIVAPIEVQ